MLPVYAKSRRAMFDLFAKLVGEAALSNNPLLLKIRIRHQKEGHRAVVDRTEGGKTEIDYKRLQAETSFKQEDMRGMSLKDFVEQATLLGKQMGEKQAEIIRAGIGDACQSNGKVTKTISVSTFEDYLAFLQSLDFSSFDENSTPKGHALFVAPGSALPGKIHEWESDPEKMQQIKAVFKAKHNEQLQREANRGLAD
jgi:hypothetical protein